MFSRQSPFRPQSFEEAHAEEVRIVVKVRREVRKLGREDMTTYRTIGYYCLEGYLRFFLDSF